MDCFMAGFPFFNISQSLLKLMSVESVMDIYPPNYLMLCHPLLLNLSHHQGLFQWVGTSHQVDQALELQLQHQSFQWIFRTDFLWDNLVLSPNCPRDFQKSSPAPQDESSISLALSLLYGPALTSIHDHWKNHSFDYMGLCQQSNVSTF